MRSRVRAQLTARRQPDGAEHRSGVIRIFSTYLHRCELALLKDRDELKPQFEELLGSLEVHVKDLYPGPWCDLFLGPSWVEYGPEGLNDDRVYEWIKPDYTMPWASYMASRRRERRLYYIASRRRRLSKICSKISDQDALTQLLSAIKKLLDINEKIAKVDLSLAEIRVERALAARANLRYWWAGILLVGLLVGRYLWGGAEGEIEAIACVLAARFLLNPEMERDYEARVLSAQNRADTERWRLDELGRSRDTVVFVELEREEPRKAGYDPGVPGRDP